MGGRAPDLWRGGGLSLPKDWNSPLRDGDLGARSLDSDEGKVVTSDIRGIHATPKHGSGHRPPKPKIESSNLSGPAKIHQKLLRFENRTQFQLIAELRRQICFLKNLLDLGTATYGAPNWLYLTVQRQWGRDYTSAGRHGEHELRIDSVVQIRDSQVRRGTAVYGEPDNLRRVVERLARRVSHNSEDGRVEIVVQVARIGEGRNLHRAQLRACGVLH